MVMIKLSDLIPVNLLEEKAQFMAADGHYNPQFTYRKIINRDQLTRYGFPRWRYLRLAKKIVKFAQNNQLFDKKPIKQTLDQNTLKHLVNQYLADYQLEHKYQVIFDKNFVSRFAVNFKDNSIKIRLPINLSLKEMPSVLNHEIGTHILRQENYLQQPWYKKRKRYGFRDHLSTEEGLAVIHSHLNQQEKSVAKTALMYWGTQVALRHSFADTYSFFYHYLNDSDKAWNYTFKLKRGLTDTGRHLAFTKSINYFEGLLKVLNYLKKHQYDPSNLYYGKLNLADIKRAKKFNPDYQPLLPKFYTADPTNYRQQVQLIAKDNFIT